MRTLPRAEPNPSAIQSRAPSRATSARWVANTQLSGESP
jgi:hypothetical protein